MLTRSTGPSIDRSIDLSIQFDFLAKVGTGVGTAISETSDQTCRDNRFFCHLR